MAETQVAWRVALQRAAITLVAGASSPASSVKGAEAPSRHEEYKFEILAISARGGGRNQTITESSFTTAS